MSKKLCFRVAAAVAAAGILLSAGSALANPFRDSDGNIHIQNLTAQQSTQLSYGTLTRRVTANYCGLLIVPVPTGGSMPASISVGGTAITTGTLPVQTVPRCVDNVLAETRAANFRDVNGRVIVVGRTAGVGYDVTYTGTPTTRNLRANACGFVRISNTLTNPAPTSFTYNSTAYTTASLPLQTPSRCYDGVRFAPQP
jgi:hypothetical protein